MTEGKFMSIFEDIKDLIKSTAKGTENAIRADMKKMESSIRKELGSDISTLQCAVSEHSKIIKDMDTRLTNEIQGVRTELTDKMDNGFGSLKTELKTEIHGVRTELIDRMDNGFGSLRTELKTEIQGVRTELKAEIREVGNKVDRLESRLDVTEPKVEVLLKEKRA